MTYKVVPQEILHESEKFYIKKPSLNEKNTLHEIFDNLLTRDQSELRTTDLTLFGINNLILVAIDKKTKEVIGGIETCFDIKSGQAVIAGFAVLPQSRKMGIGTTLLQLMDEELKKIEVKHIVALPREDSFGIFNKDGFEYIPPIKAWLESTLQDKNKFVKADMQKNL